MSLNSYILHIKDSKPDGKRRRAYHTKEVIKQMRLSAQKTLKNYRLFL